MDVQDLIESVTTHLLRLLSGEVDEVTITRKPSGKVHVTTKAEKSHEAHEAPRG
jgi:hypothetical protein